MNTKINLDKNTTRRDFVKILTVALLTISFGGLAALFNNRQNTVVSAGYGTNGYGR